MKKFLIVPLVAVILSACQTPEKKPAETAATVKYTVPDDAAITKAVADAYAAISFQKGEKPRLDEIHNYFIPQAQLINFRTDSADITNLTQFINLYKGALKAGNISMFYEEELFGRNEQFGRVAQRISTYKTYINTMDSIAERGVNSFQLIKTPQGWRVSSIIWDVEKKSLKVPEYYLKK